MRAVFAYFAMLLTCAAIGFHLFQDERTAEVFGTLAFFFLLGAALAPDYSASPQPGPDRATIRLLVPLWHPPEESYSGGRYRVKRLLESMSGFEFVVVDSDSTDLNPSAFQGLLTIYKSKALFSTHPFLFAVCRLANVAWSTIAMLLISLTTRIPCDAVYVPMSELLQLSLAGFVVAKCRRIPLIYVNLNVPCAVSNTLLHRCIWAFNRLLHNGASAVITVSRDLAATLRSQGISRPIFVGMLGVDDRALYSERPAEYDAIFVGRHVAEKGIWDLLDIWRRCCAQRPHLRLAMVGPCSSGMERALQHRIEKFGLADNVAMLGAVTEDRKWELYGSSKVCVFPSHVEGWGIVPVEAQLAGLPVVAYDLTVFQETIAQSPAAFLCRIGDLDTFARILLQTLDGAPDNSTAARGWALQFTWERAARNEEQILRKILIRMPQHNTESSATTSGYDAAG